MGLIYRVYELYIFSPTPSSQITSSSTLETPLHPLRCDPFLPLVDHLGLDWPLTCSYCQITYVVQVLVRQVQSLLMVQVPIDANLVVTSGSCVSPDTNVRPSGQLALWGMDARCQDLVGLFPIPLRKRSSISRLYIFRWNVSLSNVKL